MFGKNRFSAVREVLSIADAKSIQGKAKPGSTAEAAGANAPPTFVFKTNAQTTVSAVWRE